MRAYRSVFPIVVLFLFIILFGASPAVSHAATTCTDVYSKEATVPTGYGAAYNLFSAAKEVLVKSSSCTDTSASIAVGNGDAGMYVYKNGYYWNGSNWTLFALRSDSEPVSGGNWYLGTATYALPLTSGSTYRYYVGYTCQKVSDVWKCGCHDTTCSTASWQLQRVNKTSSGSSGPVCGNNVCESGETETSCPSDCRSSGPVCGNGVCESGENTSSCSQDCKAAGSANVIINYASAASLGTLKHISAGFLHGLPVSGITPSSLYTDLNVRLLRSRPATILQYVPLDRNMRGGSSDIVMVATLSGSWGYPNTGKTAPWLDMPAWRDYVTKQVNLLTNAIPADRLIIDFWNEPNNSHYWGAWGDPDFAHFKEVWRETYRIVKSIAPNVRVTAPGSSLGLDHLGRDNFTTDFMQYAKNNNVVPDLWNWHFGDPHTIREFNRIMDFGQSIGAPRDALILEYTREQDGKRPGRLIYEMALMDSAIHTATGKRIIGAAQAQWPTTGLLGNAVFNSGGWKKKGDWHAYADYAKMSGNQAIFTSVTTSPKIGAVASINSSAQKAWALLGNDTFDQRTSPSDTATIGNKTIRLDNIRSADASGKVNVTVSRIPYQNFGEVTDSEIVKVINNAQYTVTGNSISVVIPWGLAVDGYFMEVSNVLPN